MAENMAKDIAKNRAENIAENTENSTAENMAENKEVVLLTSTGDDSKQLFLRFRRVLKVLCGVLWFLLFLVLLMLVLASSQNGMAVTLGFVQAIVFTGVLLFTLASLHSIMKASCFFTRTLVICTAGIGLLNIGYSILWPILFPELQTSLYIAYNNGSIRVDLVGILYGILAGVVALIFYYGLRIQENDDLTI